MRINGLRTKMDNGVDTGGEVSPDYPDVNGDIVIPIIVTDPETNVSTTKYVVISPRNIKLETKVLTTVTEGIVIYTTDDSPLVPFNYTLALPRSLITPCSLTLTNPSTSTAYLEVSYTPQRVEHYTCYISFKFVDQFARVVMYLKATPTSTDFTITTDPITFGDIGTLDASIQAITVQSTLPEFKSTQLTFDVTAANPLDAFNFFVDTSKSHVETINGGVREYTYPVVYNPLYSKSSTATLRVNYRSTTIAEISLSGSKNDLEPWLLVPGDTTQISVDTLSNMDLVVSYLNNTLSNFRVSNAVITGDALGEFSITNLAFLVDSVIPPKSIIRVAVNYTPKQSSFYYPDISLKGEYF